MRLPTVLLLAGALTACSDDPTPSGPSRGPTTTTSSAATTGAGGSGGAASQGGATSGVGGAGGATTTPLETYLEALRADPDVALASIARAEGWPPAVPGGYLVATTNPAVDRVAGDHDGWQGTPLTLDEGFAWAVISASPGHGYKLHDGGDLWLADPWSRAYRYDSFGELSLVEPTDAHLERLFAVGDTDLAPRRVRIWVPAESPTHVIYVADGQNLFDPQAPWGGWNLDDAVPAAMMVVGVDNTPARMDEYTHVMDAIPTPVGGEGDAYADFIQHTVRGLVDETYGEPATVGVMGSSLGGLISLHIAHRHPGEYDFVASLSGTLGWGSIGTGVTEETMIERWATTPPAGTAVFLDSGGGGTCVDGDGDGIEDDAPDGADNFCETTQMRDTLEAVGFTTDVDLWHWWEPNAPHNEAAWAARVWRPLDVFATQ